MLRLFGLTGFILLAIVTEGRADQRTDLVRSQLSDVAGTISVQATPQMSDGSLTGCVLVFEALQRDFTYLKGNFAKVSGSVGFMSANENIAVVLKVVAVELDPSLPDLGGRLLDTSRAYIVAPDLSTNFSSLIGSYPGENGGIFAIYPLEPGGTAIMEGVVANEITIAFSVGDGSMDIQMPIQLDVADVEQSGNRILSADTTANFMSCVQTLFGQ